MLCNIFLIQSSAYQRSDDGHVTEVTTETILANYITFSTVHNLFGLLNSTQFFRLPDKTRILPVVKRVQE